MNRSALRFAAPLMTAAAVLLSASGALAESPDSTEPIPADGPFITLEDGRVIGPNGSVSFTFQEERPAPAEGTVHAFACPEVNDPATYTVKGTPRFLPDKDKPKSTWLLPDQSVSWAVSGAHTFNASVTGGVEAEAGAIIAKAKVSVDVTIGKTWTWNSTQTVTDTNRTKSGYRAVLGTVGWRLTSTKTWIAPPCNVKSKVITVDAPRNGDMSIGRQTS